MEDGIMEDIQELEEVILELEEDIQVLEEDILEELVEDILDIQKLIRI